jgi:hypothetical protein
MIKQDLRQKIMQLYQVHGATAAGALYVCVRVGEHLFETGHFQEQRVFMEWAVRMAALCQKPSLHFGPRTDIRLRNRLAHQHKHQQNDWMPVALRGSIWTKIRK